MGRGEKDRRNAQCSPVPEWGEEGQEGNKQRMGRSGLNKRVSLQTRWGQSHSYVSVFYFISSFFSVDILFLQFYVFPV